MSIYFVRHGESQANEQNRFAGHLESPLTVLGERQARHAGRIAKSGGLAFDEVHVSTLGRARRTAELLLEELGWTGDVTTSALLVERDFGVFGGKNKSLVKKAVGFDRYTEYFHSDEGAPPGGETWEELYGRAKAYYDDVLEPASDAGRTVLVVTHKYVVEMFALIVAGIDPSQYRDLKVPNARPLSEDDLRRLSGGDTAAGAVNDLGERVEIRFPLLALAGVVAGVVAHALVGVTVPHGVFQVGLGVLLAFTSFLSMLRVAPSMLRDPLLRGSRVSVLKLVPLLLLRFGLALGILQLSTSPIAVLGAVLLILPPALITPTLSLAWGGDYFASICQTIVVTLLFPVMLILVLFRGDGWMSGLDASQIPVAGGVFGVLFLCSFVVPLVAAQVFRRRSPVRAGQIVTNWNWLGAAAVIVLAAFAGFSLSPDDMQSGGTLVALFAVVLLAFAVLRLLTWLYLRFVRQEAGADRDTRISQGAPNVFLWLSLSVALFGESEDGLGIAVIVTFFLYVFVDDALFVRRQRKQLARELLALSADRSMDVDLAL